MGNRRLPSRGGNGAAERKCTRPVSALAVPHVDVAKPPPTARRKRSTSATRDCRDRIWSRRSTQSTRFAAVRGSFASPGANAPSRGVGRGRVAGQAGGQVPGALKERGSAPRASPAVLRCTHYRADMSQPPAWLTYASLLVAALALALSGATYVRAGPRVRVHASTPRGWKPDSTDELLLTVTCWHTGLAPLEISNMWLTLDGPGISYAAVELTRDHMYEGEALPVPLKEGTRKVWVYSLNELNRDKDLGSLNAGRIEFRAILKGLVSPGLSWRFLLHPIAVVLMIELGNGRLVQHRVPALTRLVVRQLWKRWKESLGRET